ncbi:hypothetical protein AALO_G00282930 [Alosa alosa]|uniref:Rho GDP-dissociation inhibitor 1 n=1 Tax=Alosa alosa TaxID=278164 RepID=A0AAV6FN79_9TELE|nr:hypothetical protein AALO_G00282930 [Alosa alosa]
MAEQEPTPEQLAALAVENEETESVNYKPPAQKSLQEIQELDKDDESLRKYKEALLGAAAKEADPNAKINVVVTRLTLMCETAPAPLTLDLQGDLDVIKKQAFILKEGVEYRIKISFKPKGHDKPAGPTASRQVHPTAPRRPPLLVEPPSIKKGWKD